jgi:hypothetical protein
MGENLRQYTHIRCIGENFELGNTLKYFTADTKKQFLELSALSLIKGSRVVNYRTKAADFSGFRF